MDQITVAEAVILQLAAATDGRGNKRPIIAGLRAACELAEETLDLPAEAFYGEPVDHRDAGATATRLLARVAL